MLRICSFVYPSFMYFFSRNSSTFSAYKTKLTLTDFWKKTFIESSKETDIQQDNRSGSKEYLTGK